MEYGEIRRALEKAWSLIDIEKRQLKDTVPEQGWDEELVDQLAQLERALSAIEHAQNEMKGLRPL